MKRIIFYLKISTMELMMTLLGTLSFNKCEYFFIFPNSGVTAEGAMVVNPKGMVKSVIGFTSSWPPSAKKATTSCGEGKNSFFPVRKLDTSIAVFSLLPQVSNTMSPKSVSGSMLGSLLMVSIAQRSASKFCKPLLGFKAPQTSGFVVGSWIPRVTAMYKSLDDGMNA